MRYLHRIFSLTALVLAFKLPFAKGAFAGPIAFLAALIFGLSQVIIGAASMLRSRAKGRVPRAGPLVAGISCIVLWGAFLPAFNAHIRSGMNSQPCPRHLSQIGVAILLYSMDHQGAYPPTLAALILKGDISSEAFICPYAGDRAAKGKTVQDMASKIAAGGHCSYHYFGAGFTSSTPSTAVVACDRLEKHKQSGVNMLFADGHVEWIDHREATRIMKEIQMGHNPPRAATTQNTVSD